MAKFNWARVQAEKKGSEIRATRPIGPGPLYSEEFLVSDSALVAKRKILRSQRKPNIGKLRKVPDCIKSHTKDIDQYALHELLYKELSQLHQFNNWTKLYQIVQELPPKAKRLVIAWIETYTPWKAKYVGQQFIRFVQIKSKEYNLEGAMRSPYWKISTTNK